MKNLLKIEQADFSNVLGERYLEYALSTIMSRSLPDVRDGLKPVHRRLIYAMHQLNLTPNTAYKKCARIVGDVIGKYHPHGDVAVYETLVRLAQDFSLRYPLIDGQGNFGSVDGDNPAAMRYTESRMTEFGVALVEDLDQDTVDFRDNYDDSDTEPILLPASFPNLLANGSEGIAVGMATNIPPHNLDELCNAAIYLIDNSDAKVSDLLDFVIGPDFPTGGVIIDSKNQIKSVYESGRGLLRVRAKWHKDILTHGLYQIIISEIPYQVQKSKLIENIAGLLKEKKLPLLENIRDESTDTIRIILEPKTRGCNPDVLMNSLFKLTDLEIRFHVNLNVLDSASVPRVMDLKELLVSFLEHRFVVVDRRSRFRINKITHRLEILQGLKIAYLNLDQVIQIIREEDDPKTTMIVLFSLSEMQVEAILNMRLRSLRKLEEIIINQEISTLSKELSYLQEIIEDKNKCMDIVKSEILEIKNKFGLSHPNGARKTNFIEVENDSNIISIEAFIEKEAITILCSEKGWIRSLKGHLSDEDVKNIKYKEGDTQRFVLHSYTTEDILIFTTSGRFYTIFADNICKNKGFGEPVNLMIELSSDNEIVSMLVYKAESKLLLISTSGKGFIIESKEALSQTKLGKQILNLSDDASKAFGCFVVSGDSFAIIGSNRKLLISNIDEIPIMKKGQGVILQKYIRATLEDIKIFNRSEGLTWKLGDRIRSEMNLVPWIGKRGTIGKLPPVGFPKNNKFGR